MTDDEIDALDRENEQRMIALFVGKWGAKVAMPPGTFEFVRVTTYLEALFSEDALRKVKTVVAQKTAEMLDALEGNVREAAIRSGGAGAGIDLATISSISRQTDSSPA